ncbi:hypothetical protein C8R47DRAFT_989021, partial [Mycena vitilis]
IEQKRPLKTWTPFKEEYLGACMELDGRGAEKNYRRCSTRDCQGVPLYRCAFQACTGRRMRCKECIVSTHAELPTHFIEKWTGACFVRTPTALRDLGLVIQLEHPAGVICPLGKAAAKDFVLYDTTGVHEIGVNFCGCIGAPERRMQLIRVSWWPATVLSPNTCATFSALRLFQALNCGGKLSAFDFLKGLELITSNDGLEIVLIPIKDRRKPFMHIVRQWREVKRLKRAARGYEKGGVASTEQGGLTLRCRACPQPGYNLPDGWESSPPWMQFLYFLFLAQDANFRLIGRNVSSEEADPIWGDGQGYFCNQAGYKEHIAKHVNEEEISSCSGFQALFLANVKRLKGLRTTGVAGVTCSRHNMWRANGIGALQLGERYCNMDFVFLSSLLGFALLYIILSYDVACQYNKKFWERMLNLPDDMHLHLPPDNVWWKVPNFHLPPHKPPCHAPYSFHWMWGAGMTHGEGVEQNWAFSNGAAPSTKLMGPGSWHATLEDVFSFHNYDRQLAMHRVLPKRLAVNIKEGAKHQAALDSFTAALEVAHSAQVDEWRTWVKAWESKQHRDPSLSPFDLKEEVTTMKDIQLAIAQEELIATDDGVAIEREDTPSTFIMMGLGIEETARQLEIDIKALPNPTTHQRLEIVKRRTSLLKSIAKFRKQQMVYMPVVRSFLSEEQKTVFDGNSDQQPECTRLFLPSDILEATQRGKACAVGLADLEARLRHGEATEALESVRQGLRARTLTNRFKIRNFTGQGALTRGQKILRDINLAIHLAKIHYRYARNARLVLTGHGDWEDQLRVLKDEDVRALNERALTEEEKANRKAFEDMGNVIEGGVAVASTLAPGEGSRTLSWIWYTVGATEVTEEGRLNEALRVEWCKAFARGSRYREEIRLLSEEMRRTIASGESEIVMWKQRTQIEEVGASDELVEGRWAYAAKRMIREERTCAALRVKWGPILAKARQYLDNNAAVDQTLVSVELEPGDEMDREEEEARLEAEEDDL